MNKKDIIQLLEKIALYLEIKGESNFRVSAYRKAAQAIERDERSLGEIDDFGQIKGIGKGTNAVISEFIETGNSVTLTELESEIPVSLLDLLHIPGLGGKRIAKLYQELNIIDIASLKEACTNASLEQLPGFGKTTVKNILKAINELNQRPERIPAAIMLSLAEKIEAALLEIPSIIRFSRAGSLRRMREMLKDIDFIIATENSRATGEALVNLDGVKEIIAHGDTKVSVVFADVYDISVDFRLVTKSEFATTLHHFTGSKDHNIVMRQIAKSRGEKINEYGVVNEETGKIQTFTSEEEFFAHFDLPFIPPEIREGTDEFIQMKEKQSFISPEDILGDLHLHTTWSDGAGSIEEMVQAAIERGYKYMAITDHSKFLRVANGLYENRLKRQIEEIISIRDKYPDFYIFTGTEMDILPDGSLDFDDEMLSKLDFVIASIHSSFNQTEEQIMHRLYQAMENPFVNLIAHPTGRILGGRAGYAVNVEKLIEKAVETGTALEINANPHRFDLSAKWARIAEEQGAILSINTDAHNIQGLNHMGYGVSVAKRGFIQKDTVINTWSLEKLKAFITKN